MKEFRVRHATVADIETLTRHRHEMFDDMEKYTASEHRIADTAFPGWARREMRARRMVCFLVEDKGRRVVAGGSVWLREVQPYPGFPGGRAPYLMSMYTEPSHRGKGLATLVAKESIKWAREHGHGSLSLHASDMGRPIYEKLGWKATNEMRLKLR